MGFLIQLDLLPFFAGLGFDDADIANLSGDLLWLVGFTVIGLALASLRFKKRLG